PVVAVDHPNGAGLRTHHDGLCGRPARTVVHTAQQITVGDAGGAEEHVVAPHEVVGGQHPVEVVPRVDRLLPLLVVLRPQPALQLAAEALHGARRDDALRRTADTEQHVATRGRSCRPDRSRPVTVTDEPDTRPGLAHFLDDLHLVTTGPNAP